MVWLNIATAFTAEYVIPFRLRGNGDGDGDGEMRNIMGQNSKLYYTSAYHDRIRLAWEVYKPVP